MTQAQQKTEKQSLWIWPFELKEQIGEGGMGVVYRARYVVNDRELAVKMVPADVTDKTALARFEREMAVLKDLKHPNIVRCFGGVCENKRRFYAMELIPGGSLEDLLQQKGKFSWEQVVEYGLQMCAALECSHRHGVIHRDVKPGNFLIAANSRLKLSDFGLASVTTNRRITQMGKTAGTFLYMAPEQIRGKDLSPQTDLYALGCVLFELLSGCPPFVAETPAATLHMHCKKPPPRITETVLGCPVALEQLIDQLLAKEPTARPESAAAVARVLRTVTQTITVRPPQTDMGAVTSVGNRPVAMREQLPETAEDSVFYKQPPVLRQSAWAPYLLIAAILALSVIGSALQRQSRVSQHWEETVLRQLGSSDYEVQVETLRMLGKIGSDSPRGLKELGRSLEHENAAIRLAAVNALGEAGAGARAHLPTLHHLQNVDTDQRVRSSAQMASRKIREAPAESRSWLLPVFFCLLAVAAGAGWHWWTSQRPALQSPSGKLTSPD